MRKLLYCIFPLFTLIACGNSDVTVVMDSSFSLVFPANLRAYMRSIDQMLPEDIGYVILPKKNVSYVQRNIVMRSDAILTVTSVLPQIETIFREFALAIPPALYYIDFFQELPQENATPVLLNRDKAFAEAGDYAGMQVDDNTGDSTDPNTIVSYLFILEIGEHTTDEVEAFRSSYIQHVDNSTLKVRKYQPPLNGDALRSHIESSSVDAQVLVFAIGPHIADILHLLDPLPRETTVIVDNLLSETLDGGFIDAEIRFQLQDMLDYVIKHEKGLGSTDEKHNVEAVFYRYFN